MPVQSRGDDCTGVFCRHERGNACKKMCSVHFYKYTRKRLFAVLGGKIVGA